MLLILAAALGVGSAVAVEEAQFFFFVLPAIFMLAMAIAALLLAPLIAGRGLTGRPPKPPWPIIAVALAVGALIVFPVKADLPREGRVCEDSTVALPEQVLNELTDDEDATVVYVNTCTTGGVEDSVQNGGSG
ncbi:hypothetical protein DVA67_019335 [Solirubrobacter sp. CPCC 204708]|uniref:Uncharacterized protein n=1 Tax=Solirubrobacter deserti TaxID=2282478 RepID=A0ABT4RFU8_9ACTN|nr:hypothetical protein [Solirubrobacter deserti]MBE2318144.1 hypothetical protein [Solirubrobacter deserti]MDA0137423.1 hypothetical protein [Solirubrobacter deserti]